MRRKGLKITVLTVLALLVVSLVLLTFMGSSLVPRIAQKTASGALGSEVSIGGMSLSLPRRTLNISDMSIANIPGYEAEHIMRVGNIHVGFAPLSFLTGEIKLREIRIEGLEVYLEQKGLKNNLREFQALMDSGAEKEKAQKNVSVEHVLIDGILLNTRMAGRTGTLRIDPITLDNVGTGENMAMGRIMTRITGAVVTGAFRQLGGVFRPQEASPETASEEEGVIEGIRRLIPSR